MTDRYESAGDFIDGAWQKADVVDGSFERENPCRLNEVSFAFDWSLAHVDHAVDAARRAQPSWDRLGFEQRRELLLRFEQVLTARKSELAHAISIETGKPTWEALTEAGALAAKIRIMTNQGAKYTQHQYPEGVPGRYVHRPLGVLAVLGPFNFPLHLPNGHIIPALLNGNTVVVKPSELTSASMQMYMQCAIEAGLPAGVINMVLGAGQVGAKLAAHEHVDGVLFTGSYETGLRIKRATLEQHWKLLALEMGGKNTSIVLEDADVEQVVHEVVQAAFLTCGQRCSATSRLIIRNEIIDDVIDALTAKASRITTGDSLTEEAYMGPLINKRAFDHFLSVQQDDEDGNLQRVLTGGADRADLNGYYVKPAIWRVRDNARAGGVHQSTEIFGPDLVLYGVDSDDEAAALAERTEYGLAMSVFTADRGRFDEFVYRGLRTGILNWNRSTAGASSQLPFGGVKKSGNHRPAAILAGLYCAYPQAQLLNQPGWDDAKNQAMPLKLLVEPS